MKNYFRIFIVLVAMAMITPDSHAQQNQLDQYILEAFSHNEGLQQNKFQLEKSVYALEEARAMFLPSVSLLGSYNGAVGGRTIDFPIGDLLNPVYSTLNQLTSSQQFQQLGNYSALLNPNKFYDAKFRTSLSIVNAEIIYNKQIKKQLISLQQAEVNIYKRELVKEIKMAYFRYEQSLKAVRIYDNALLLIEQNLKVNESLVRNGLRNATALSRAEAEMQRIETERNKAEYLSRDAQAHFNFLLNRTLDSFIQVDTVQQHVKISVGYDSVNLNKREELQQFRATTAIYDLNKKISRAYLIPKLSAFVDLGSQGFNLEYNSKTRYYFYGVNLEWNIFSFGRNTHKVQQAESDRKINQSVQNQANDRIQLQTYQSYNSYATALANQKTVEHQLLLAGRYFHDQSKAYKEGMVLYIEWLDAQNQFTSAQLQSAIAETNVQIAEAEIERNESSYPIQ